MTDPHPLHSMLALAVSPLGEAWHDFYLLTGTAAVTLVGLLFVSLSLHVEILFRREHGDFREMAGQAFQGYLYVLVSSLVFLAPVSNLYWALGTYGILNVVMLVRALVRIPAYVAARRAQARQGPTTFRFALPFIAYGLGLLAVAQGLGGETGSAITLLAPMLLMLMAATRTAWSLLEYVGRAKAGAGAAANPP